MTEENMNEREDLANVDAFEGDEQFLGSFSQEGFVDLDAYEYVEIDDAEYAPYESEAFDPSEAEEAEEFEIEIDDEEDVPSSFKPKHAAIDLDPEEDEADEDAEGVEDAASVEAIAAPATAAATTVVEKPAGASRGKHAKPEPVISESVKKSRKTRKILIGVLVVLVLALAGVGGGMFFALNQSPAPNTDEANQQQTAEQDAMKDAETSDTSNEVEKRTSVPNVMDLLEKTEKQIMDELQHGATVTASLEVNDPTLPYAKSVTIELSDEYADARTGLPKVYLGLNKKGKAIQVGYSVGTSLLGYASMDVKEAMESDHVVEQVTTSAGIPVKEGSLKLPKKASDYTTYGTDGTTVVKERVSFDGTTKKSGTKYLWESVLLFDYTTSSITGNINDAAHQVYIYVTDAKAQKAADKAAAKKAKAEAKKKAKEEAKKKAAAKKAAKKASKKS